MFCNCKIQQRLVITHTRLYNKGQIINDREMYLAFSIMAEDRKTPSCKISKNKELAAGTTGKFKENFCFLTSRSPSLNWFP